VYRHGGCKIDSWRDCLFDEYYVTAAAVFANALCYQYLSVFPSLSLPLILPSSGVATHGTLGHVPPPKVSHLFFVDLHTLVYHYQNCSVLYCVLKLCTVISTLRWAVLTVLWIGFCHIGPTSLYVDWFICVYLCVFCVIFSYCVFVILLWAWWGAPDGRSLILEPYLPSALWHCWLGNLTRKIRPRYDL